MKAGYPELGKGDLYIDGLMVHMAHIEGLKQVIMQEPMRIYHIEHDEGWIARKDKNTIRRQLSIDYNKEYKAWCQKMLGQKWVITNNGKNWGYPESQFEEKKIRGRYQRDVSKNKDEKIAVDKRELFRTWIGTFAGDTRPIICRFMIIGGLSWIYVTSRLQFLEILSGFICGNFSITRVLSESGRI